MFLTALFMLVGGQLCRAVISGMPRRICVCASAMRSFLAANKWARKKSETEGTARKEKTLTTELRAIYICSASASLILLLAVCFVYRESEPYSCHSWALAARWVLEEDAEEGGRESKGTATGSQSRIWVTSYLPLQSNTGGVWEKKRERELELCLHVSSQRHSIVERGRQHNWL